MYTRPRRPNMVLARTGRLMYINSALWRACRRRLAGSRHTERPCGLRGARSRTTSSAHLELCPHSFTCCLARCSVTACNRLIHDAASVTIAGIYWMTTAWWDVGVSHICNKHTRALSLHEWISMGKPQPLTCALPPAASGPAVTGLHGIQRQRFSERAGCACSRPGSMTTRRARHQTRAHGRGLGSKAPSAASWV